MPNYGREIDIGTEQELILDREVKDATLEEIEKIPKSLVLYRVTYRETISTLTSSIGFTNAMLKGNSAYAVIQATGGNIRFTIDGSTPTTSLGMRLVQDASVEIWGTEAMEKFRCIDDGGVAALEVIYMAT